MSEAAVKAVPRRGRLWVIALFALTLFGVGYLVVEVATQEPNDDIVRIDGIGDSQQLFGGVPQEGDRIGSDDAAVTIQVFNDLQCANCRDDFLTTIPTLVEDYARPGDVKLLYRHYSNSESPQEIGFYGAEAAAAQGYGWQYTYLFFRNQDEAERFGVDQDFLDSVAGGVAQLNAPEWEAVLEQDGGSGGPISERLEADEELGRDLGIRYGQAMIVTGPNGTQTLQEGPTLAEVERAIAEVQ
ncbi:MAG TPA: thioredoxin domain-containing protein [Solirubrobacterales bacterium]|nr:thioredoxin domain-containing protein [Solirubrobacterales bacterium]